jgi:hypothetical protein
VRTTTRITSKRNWDGAALRSTPSFQQRQYVVVGKYLRMDTENLYFMPAAARN